MNTKDILERGDFFRLMQYYFFLFKDVFIFFCHFVDYFFGAVVTILMTSRIVKHVPCILVEG